MLMMLPLPWPCMTRTSCFMLRITPAESRDGPIDEMAQFVLMANIGTDELGFGAERAQLGGKLPAGILAAAGNHETGTFLGKSERGRSADPGECTCDQDNWVAHGSVLLDMAGGELRVFWRSRKKLCKLGSIPRRHGLNHGVETSSLLRRRR